MGAIALSEHAWLNEEIDFVNEKMQQMVAVNPVPAEHEHFLQNDGERIKVIFAWFFNL